MSRENPRDVSRVVVTRFGWRFLGWELSCTSGKVHLLLRSQGSRQFWSQFKTLPSSVEASLETTLAIWSKKNTVILNKTIFEASKKQHKQIPFLKVFKTERNSAVPGLSKSHSTSGYFTAVVCDLKLCEPRSVQILGKLKKISKFQYPRLSHSHKPCQSKKCKNKKCIKICERKNLQVNGKKSAVTISTSYTSMLFVHCSPRKKFHLLTSLVYAYTLCLGKTCLSTLDAGATRQCLGSTVTEGQATSSWKKTQKRLWALHQTAQRFRHFLMHSPSGGIVLEPDTLVHKADFKRFKRMHPNRIANHVHSLRSFPQQAKTPITRREEICHLSFLCRVTIWDALNRNVVVACECSWPCWRCGEGFQDASSCSSHPQKTTLTEIHLTII